jgi:hypothetical protein
MAGLVPAIHFFLPAPKDVDARDKPGYDEWRGASPTKDNQFINPSETIMGDQWADRCLWDRP